MGVIVNPPSQQPVMAHPAPLQAQLSPCAIPPSKAAILEKEFHSAGEYCVWFEQPGLTTTFRRRILPTIWGKLRIIVSLIFEFLLALYVFSAYYISGSIIFYLFFAVVSALFLATLMLLPLLLGFELLGIFLDSKTWYAISNKRVFISYRKGLFSCSPDAIKVFEDRDIGYIVCDAVDNQSRGNVLFHNNTMLAMLRREGYFFRCPRALPRGGMVDVQHPLLVQRLLEGLKHNSTRLFSVDAEQADSTTYQPAHKHQSQALLASLPADVHAMIQKACGDEEMLFCQAAEAAETREGCFYQTCLPLAKATRHCQIFFWDMPWLFCLCCWRGRLQAFRRQTYYVITSRRVLIVCLGGSWFLERRPMIVSFCPSDLSRMMLYARTAQDPRGRSRQRMQWSLGDPIPQIPEDYRLDLVFAEAFGMEYYGAGSLVLSPTHTKIGFFAMRLGPQLLTLLNQAAESGGSLDREGGEGGAIFTTDRPLPISAEPSVYSLPQVSESSEP